MEGLNSLKDVENCLFLWRWLLWSWKFSIHCFNNILLVFMAIFTFLFLMILRSIDLTTSRSNAYVLS